MPKTFESIRNSGDTTFPLRLSYLKPRRGGTNGRVLVRCGCCRNRLEIHAENPELPADADPHQTLIEIGGVKATVDQWRQVFGPILGVSPPLFRS